MSYRRISVIAVIAALCAFGTGVRAAGEPYNIDVIEALTGPAAFIGQTHVKELTALEGLVNKSGGIAGRPVHFVFHDDETNPQISRQLAAQIAATHPAVVLGSTLGALCQAALPLYADGPVDYCFSPVITPPRGGYVFSASVSGRDLMLASLRYFRGRGWKRIATLNTTDSSGQIADADIAALLKLPENKDLQIVDAEHFNPADTNVSAQVAKIKASNPQALILWAPGTPFGTGLHGIQDVGLDVPVMTTSANMVVSQLKTYGQLLPKDLYFQGVAYIAGVQHTKDTRPMQQFTAAIKAAGIAQDFQSGIAWDPAMIVIDALRKLGPGATAQQLHAYIENLHDYTGINGVYDFRGGNQRGLTVNDTLMMRWDAAKSDFVTVSKFGGLP